MSRSTAYEVLYPPEAFKSGTGQFQHAKFENAIHMATGGVLINSNEKWQIFRQETAQSIESIEGDLVLRFVVPKERGGDSREELHRAIDAFEGFMRILSPTGLDASYRIVEGEDS